MPEAELDSLYTPTYSTVMRPGCHVFLPMIAFELQGGARFLLSSILSMCQTRCRIHHITLPAESVTTREDSFFSIIPFAVVAVALTRALPVLAGSLRRGLIFLMSLVAFPWRRGVESE